MVSRRTIFDGLVLVFGDGTAAMRSIWKGTVSFGLVSIGVKLFSATEERDVSFHQVRRSDGSRIRYKRIAEADGEEVAFADIAKGYQLPDGGTVVLSDDDFADLPLPTAKVVDVLQFVPLEQIDPIYFAKSYYLEPEKPAQKPYVLLRDALEASGMAGLVKVAIRSREQLATLRVRDGVIVLETMIWPDEVREPDFGFLDEEVELRPQERSMAESLVASMAGDFDPALYSDDYRAALQQVIDAKVEGRQIVSTEPAQPTAGNVVDLMSALRASVDAAKRSRGEVPEAAAKASAPAPAKKVPPTKVAAKKVAAKKVAAKQAAAPSAKKAPAKKAPAKAQTAKTTSAAKRVAATKPAKRVPTRRSA
jgi:DNA end-binding protein Ku